MARRTEIPQLAHVPEDGDAGTRDAHRGESIERRAHGIGVRVVRIVHNREAPARREYLLTPRLGLGSAERLDDHLEGKPRSEAHRRCRARVVDVVQAGERKRAGSALASRIAREPTREKGKRGTARIVERDMSRPNRTPRAPAASRILAIVSRSVEAHCANSTLCPPSALPHEVRHIVGAVQESDAAFGKRGDELGFGARDVLTAAEQLDVAFADLRDNSPLGAHEGAQRLDLSESAHAHLDHDVAGISIGGKQRVWHAELVVLVTARSRDAPRAG